MTVRMPGDFSEIDPARFLVKTFVRKVGHRMPAEDEINWDTRSVSMEHIEINPLFPAGTFQFVSCGRGGCGSGGPRGRLSFAVAGGSRHPAVMGPGASSIAARMNGKARRWWSTQNGC